MTDQLIIAVMSDLHCKHGGDKSLTDTQTFLTTELDLKPTNRHPIESIKKIIKDESLTADILVCPGDLTDKMDKAGLFLGWKLVHEIKNELGATDLYATVGNHDVDSRKKYDNPHAFDIIKQLSDSGYPTVDGELNSKYWAHEYCIIQKSEVIIVNYNSCFSHTDEMGVKECIIKTETIDAIESELKSIKGLDKKFKILMLHHHPQHHSNYDLKFKDSDFVQNGDRLLEKLEELSFDIVIHGHKHEPKLRMAGRLPIFSSGSFSSMMNIVDIGAQNTFHLILMNKALKNGIIKTWCYGPVKGWSQDEGTYFPSLTGYGARKTPEEIVEECNDYYNSRDKPFITFEELSEEFPDIKYLVPLEQMKLTSMLADKYKLNIYPSIFNKPSILIRQHK